MKKPITTALLILVSGLTLSTTVLAEPYKWGSGYVNALSNEYSVPSTPSVRGIQSIQRSQITAMPGGFNDRDSGEYGEVAINSRTVLEIPVTRMITTVNQSFNDRG